VQDLATRALTVTADPELRLTARHYAGWALAWSGRRAAALSALISVAEEAARDQPALAWDALGSAATVAYQSGMPASRQAVSRALGLLERRGPQPPGRAPGIDVDVLRLWIRASADPIGSRNQLLPHLRKIVGSPIKEPSLWRIGSAAWLLDESDLAITLLQDAIQWLRAPGVRGTSGGSLTVLGWRLGARSWAQRTEAELRASGVAITGAPGEPDALGELTPQQRQIVRLASDGLTDREIDDRLFLSPRTVSSHLYRSYPKLGVAGRHQLRDVIARASTPATAHASAGSETLL
jgi:DNA-binding CsgD family transcriptional regulator